MEVRVKGSSAVKFSRQDLLNCIKSRAVGQNLYSALSLEMKEWEFNRLWKKSWLAQSTDVNRGKAKVSISYSSK